MLPLPPHIHTSVIVGILMERKRKSIQLIVIRYEYMPLPRGIGQILCVNKRLHLKTIKIVPLASGFTEEKEKIHPLPNR